MLFSVFQCTLAALRAKHLLRVLLHETASVAPQLAPLLLQQLPLRPSPPISSLHNLQAAARTAQASSFRIRTHQSRPHVHETVVAAPAICAELGAAGRTGNAAPDDTGAASSTIGPISASGAYEKDRAELLQQQHRR